MKTRKISPKVAQMSEELLGKLVNVVADEMEKVEGLDSDPEANQAVGIALMALVHHTLCSVVETHPRPEEMAKAIEKMLNDFMLEIKARVAVMSLTKAEMLSFLQPSFSGTKPVVED